MFHIASMIALWVLAALPAAPKIPRTPEERADYFVARAIVAWEDSTSKLEWPMREKRERLAAYQRAEYRVIKTPAKYEYWRDPQTKKRLFTGGPNAKEAQIAALESDIKDLERKCEWTPQNILVEYRPRLNITPPIGDLGTFPTEYTSTLYGQDLRIPVVIIAQQVVDESNLLGRLELHGDEMASFWLSGMSTAGIVDDQRIAPTQMFIVSGTKQYPTAIGSTRTLLLVERFDLDMKLAAERCIARKPP